MIQITPQMRILVAIEPVDFRAGIDGIARMCRERLDSDPFSGTAYVFRNRRGTLIKVLVFDSQGFWLCQRRLSEGKFRSWPTAEGGPAAQLAAHALLADGRAIDFYKKLGFVRAGSTEPLWIFDGHEHDQ